MAEGDVHERFRAAGWSGRVAPRWRHLVSDDPLRLLRARGGQLVRQRPSAATFRIETDAGALYVKHRTARKDDSGSTPSWPRRVAWRWRAPLALRVLRVHRQLAGRGLLVAPVVLAARRRNGGGAEELLVTGEVAGTDLHRAFLEAADDRRRALMEMTGRRMAELHRLGFVHGDLLPGNLLVTADGANLVYLDNDRSRRWYPGLPANVRRRNVAQMAFRLTYWFNYRWTRLLLESYYAAYGLGGTARRRETAWVLRRARRRARGARPGAGRRLPRLA